jgi:hypothetical protein
MTNNIVNNCNFDAADPTERHVSDVGILNKYNYYLFIYYPPGNEIAKTHA